MLWRWIQKLLTKVVAVEKKSSKKNGSGFSDKNWARDQVKAIAKLNSKLLL